MSEKRAKGALKAYYKPCVTDCQCPACRTVESVIAAAPDLVGLLRWAYSQKREHEGLAREARKKSHSPLSEANELYLQIAHDEEGIAHTYSLVIEEIEKVVLLTDDGWEWVE